ncbi:HalOD1 output domain-containing protein [Haloarcula laminariae]|uniref:HalOD1 output domain-containing protein n=1 Tax=Haloarcula laminariae TaxID=2961577 RepID=UPI0021CA9E62|nr:HalOD1 output domain-containing protein [Halomicroarcula laminariae]
MYRNETHANHSPRHQGAGTYFVKHDFDGSAELTTTLAHALSDISGVDVTDAGFTLYDYIDPDALDRLFKPGAGGAQRVNGTLTLTVWDHQVTIHSDGQIAIVPPQQTPQPTR